MKSKRTVTNILFMFVLAVAMIFGNLASVCAYANEPAGSANASQQDVYYYGLIPGSTDANGDESNKQDIYWVGLNKGTFTGLGAPGDYSDKQDGVTVNYFDRVDAGSFVAGSAFPNLTFNGKTYTYVSSKEQNTGNTYTLEIYRLVRANGVNAGNNGYFDVINSTPSWHLDHRILLGDVNNVSFFVLEPGATEFTFLDKYYKGYGADTPMSQIEQPSEADVPLTKETYSFSGWYTDKECTQPADFSGTLTGNMSFYGKYTSQPATANRLPVKVFVLSPLHDAPTSGEDQGHENYYPDSVDGIEAGDYLTVFTEGGLNALRGDDGKALIGDQLFVQSGLDKTLLTDALFNLINNTKRSEILIQSGLTDDPNYVIIPYVAKVQTGQGSVMGTDEGGTAADIHIDCWIKNVQVNVTYHSNTEPYDQEAIYIDKVNTGSDYIVKSGLADTGITAPDGYSFAGWYLDRGATGTGQDGTTVQLTSEKHLYAKWVEDGVRYFMPEGPWSSAYVYVTDGKIDELPKAALYNKMKSTVAYNNILQGISAFEDMEDGATLGYTVSEPMETIEGGIKYKDIQVTPLKAKVIFKTEDLTTGSLLDGTAEKEKMEYTRFMGGAADMPEVKAATGYYFDGWYLDNVKTATAGTVELPVRTKYYELTYVAKFKKMEARFFVKRPFNNQYNLFAGTGTVKEEDGFMVADEVPVEGIFKAIMDFQGYKDIWGGNLTTDEANLQYFLDDAVEDEEEGVSFWRVNVTPLMARVVFRSSDLDIGYMVNKGVQDEDNEMSYTRLVNDIAPVPTLVVKDGYVFDGWYKVEKKIIVYMLKKTGKSASDKLEADVTDLEITEDVVYEARFKEAPVTPDPGPGDTGGGGDDTPIAVPTPTPTTAPAPGGVGGAAVLGARRADGDTRTGGGNVGDGAAVLGARRGQTGEESQAKNIMVIAFAAAAAAALAALGRKKKKED